MKIGMIHGKHWVMIYVQDGLCLIKVYFMILAQMLAYMCMRASPFHASCPLLRFEAQGEIGAKGVENLNRDEQPQPRIRLFEAALGACARVKRRSSLTFGPRRHASLIIQMRKLQIHKKQKEQQVHRLLQLTT